MRLRVWPGSKQAPKEVTGERYSYSVCDKHDVCVSCDAHRSKLTAPCGVDLTVLSASHAKTERMRSPR